MEEFPIPEESLAEARKKRRGQRYFGSCYVCCFIRNEPLFSLGPDYMCFVCTFLFKMVLFYLVYLQSDTDEVNVKILTRLVLAVQLLSYFLTAVINPGIQSRKEGAVITREDREKFYCHFCQIYQDDFTYHCVYCDICILEYDHHCPWTGKCIGKYNQRIF